MSPPDWRNDVASFAQRIDGIGWRFRCIGQGSLDATLSPEPATSEPEPIYSIID